MNIELQNPFTNAKITGVSVPGSEYMKQPCARGVPDYVMSRSDLVEFDRCPSRWRAGYKEDDTDQTRWGSLIDCMVLTPERFSLDYAVAPETYKNEKGEVKPWNWNANVCKEWREQAGDAEVLKSDQHAKAKTAADLLRTQMYGLLNGDTQVAVVGEFKDKETGLVIPVKCLIDLVPESDGPYGKALFDLKTAASAHPRAWQRAVFERGYHVQAAMNLDLYTAATDEDRCEFRHIIQENFEPWQIGRRLLSSEFVELGRLSYIRSLRKYAQCLKTGEWPDYEQGNEVVDGYTITQPEAWMIAV